MQIVWRMLPRLTLPLAVGLGAAYLVTAFVPRPAPSLRPPEDLRARGQAFAEESPLRAILERNVLRLESPLFEPAGRPPAPDPEARAQAEAAAPPLPVKKAPAQAAFAPVEPKFPERPPDPPLAEPPRAPAAPAQAEAPRPASQTAAAAPQPAPAAPELAGVRLVGVIAGGERPLAMLQVDGQALSARPGDLIKGWTLVGVEPGAAVLKQNGHTRRIALGGR